MARGTTLEQLIRMFRLEVGQSAQLAQGIQNKENIAQGLRRTQETLYYDFDWPFLRVYEYEQLQPGERVYTWPQNVKLEYVRQLYDQWGERWTPIGYGINFQLRNEYQPGETSDPVLAWQEVGPDRMKARNLDPQGLREFYKERSLLKVSVLPAHVGEAVVFFAAQRTPTTGATLPVDGGIPGAFPR